MRRDHRRCSNRRRVRAHLARVTWSGVVPKNIMDEEREVAIGGIGGSGYARAGECPGDYAPEVEGASDVTGVRRYSIAARAGIG